MYILIDAVSLGDLHVVMTDGGAASLLHRLFSARLHRNGVSVSVASRSMSRICVATLSTAVANVSPSYLAA